MARSRQAVIGEVVSDMTTPELPEDDHQPGSGESRGLSRRRWPWFAGLGAIVAVVLGFMAGTNGSSQTGDQAVDLRTAEVVRTDLVDVQTLEGTLGRAEGETVASAVAGTVTAAAEPGTTVVQGEILFEIDAEPVVLLYGETPAYRDLTLSEDTTSVVARTFGTVTTIVDDGTAVEQGNVLFEIDGEPVVALYGEVPAYRTMRDLRSDNMTGADVAQLEAALVALGYDPDGTVTVDDEFTDATEKMVERWQKDIGAVDDGTVDLGDVVFVPGPTEVVAVHLTPGDTVSDGRAVLGLAGDKPLSGRDVAQLEAALSALGYDADGAMAVDDTFTAETKSAVIEWQTAVGLEPDGVLSLGEVVFLPEAVRVAARVTSTGSPVSPGGPVLTVTASRIVVTADLPAQDQDILAVGDSVEVELPNGTRAPGRVDEIASVAALTQAGETVFKVTILLDDPSVAGDLDEAPVDVDVVTDSVENVVAVPVTALLALAEGGYAVELQTGLQSTRLIAVEPGFFADGLVEITAGEILPGDLVVIP